MPGPAGDAVVVGTVGMTVLVVCLALLRLTAPRQFRLLAGLPGAIGDNRIARVP